MRSSPFSKQRVGGVELNRQRSDGVRQDIVDFTSDAVALGQGRGTIPFGIGPDPLGQELLGLERPLHVLASAGADHEPDDHRQRPFGDEDPRSIHGHVATASATTPMAPTPRR